MKPTKVIFRKWSNGDVIALFPEIPATDTPHHCMSYEHVGQHGAASPAIVLDTVPAKPAEYQQLLFELRRVGYKTLKIVKRFQPQDLEARRAALK